LTGFSTQAEHLQYVKVNKSTRKRLEFDAADKEAVWLVDVVAFEKVQLRGSSWATARRGFGFPASELICSTLSS
jgi:hypothetical protein